MLFNSYEFIFIFLPLILFGYYRLGRYSNHYYSILWLLFASLFFYGWWNPAYLSLIAFSIIVNYLTGLLLSRLRAGKQDKLSAIVLATGVTINLMLIGYFKYIDFLIGSTNVITGHDLPHHNILLPIGISFFTFQQIAYLVDVKYGTTDERNFLNYSLFVVFFPQLIAGPIVHHKEILPQFARPSTFRFSSENLAIGMTIFAIGLVKKVLIADQLALVASPVFSAAEEGGSLHFFQAWGGVFAYSFQLYFDFSGYSDMAIGLARMFGVLLPVNFNSPYKAVSIIEFWRRWHMTLSRFLRDYLYVPLGGNKKGRGRRYINLMVTMLLGGLWHGASWNFVIWGGLHGIFLTINHAWRRFMGDRSGNRLYMFIARACTFFLVTLAWVFFRAESFQGALSILDGMRILPHTLVGRIGPLEQAFQAIGFRLEGPPVSNGDLLLPVWLVFWLVIVWRLPNTQELLSRFMPAIGYERQNRTIEQPRHDNVFLRISWAPTVGWAVLLGIVSFAVIFSLSSVSEFIYFQF